MISIITPSVRPEALKVVENCLNRQKPNGMLAYEWIVVSPEEYGFGEMNLKDPPKRESDFYNLNKAWNAGLKKAKGDLFVSIVDGLWFPPDTLARLWDHYQRDPMSCISLTGDQYDKVENGKPEHKVWVDPRRKGVSFYEIPPYDLELCIASLPMKGVKEVGGFDEEFDKFPAWSEKDLVCRMAKIGYKCYIDESVEYRAVKHDRISGSKWDKLYPQSTAYFQKCYKEIQNGTRLKLDFLSK